MTVGEALRIGAARLDATSDTARLDAELLMAHALGVSRSELLLRHMQDSAPAAFSELIDRRAAHEPIAYITGYQEFWGLNFLVTPAVLIPRADSETTLQAALDAMPQATSVLDCGTGSGALLLAFLAERPAARGVGVDRSLAAMAVAAENAARLGLSERARILHADWDKPGWAQDIGQFDCVIANPPYVEEDAALAPDVREFEPAGALFAGAHGMDAYRMLVPQLPQLLTPSGVAVLEIGATQAEAVTKIAVSHGFTVSIAHDLADRTRALILR